MSSNQSEFLTEEEAEKLEVTCGFCERKVRIRSLVDHVKAEHSDNVLQI